MMLDFNIAGYVVVLEQVGKGDVHMHHTPPDIYLSFYPDIFECLLAKPILAQCFAATSYWTVCWTR